MVSHPGSASPSFKPGLSSSGFGLTRHNHLTKVLDAGCLEHHTHGNQGTQNAEEADIELSPRRIKQCIIVWDKEC